METTLKPFELFPYLQDRTARVEKGIEGHFSLLRVEESGQRATPTLLVDAMLYSASGGGKRIRPLLVIAAGEAVGGSVERVLPAAVALEMIHTYSLIHDDLPAMDNDAFRRGRPTSHTVYGEAMAILAGDGLLTFAFELLAGEAIRQGWDPALSLRILHELAVGAGPRGMVGGQVLDIALEGKSVDLKTLEAIHSSKTGAMIRASVRIGALLGGADPASLESLTSYAERIGLAFQVADDILDVEGDASLLGKRTHKDAEQKKNTYPSLIGLQQAKDLRDGLIQGGIQDLAGLGDTAEPLRGIARYIADRNR